MDHDQHHPDAEEHRRRRSLGQTEAAITEQRERGLEGGERDHGDEADECEVAQHRRVGHLESTAAGPVAGATGLGQANDRGDRVDGGQHAGHVERHVRPTECSEASDGRSEHEADAECRAEQADEPRPLGLGCHVAHGRLGDGQAAARRAVDDATEEQHPQRPRCTGYETADCSTDQGDDDDGFAPDVIRQPSEQWGTQQLGE